ncbi:MAG: Clp protease N-terminal domain-containing protein [Candidatus Saccharibacteria bacterium]|nr:Clp protease N-terminal domain-containing protein [Candidatus Saccharibacteria bacterium]
MLDEDASRALTLGETRAFTNGHHAMMGAEYILYGVLAYIEEESVELWLQTPHVRVTAEMVMSRIVLITGHSDRVEDDLARCECYESTLVRAIELAYQDGSEFVELKHLLLAITREEGSLALNILKGLRAPEPQVEFVAFMRGELK